MKTDLDDIDRRLIAILQNDGRRSFKEISEETGIPASSVRYRVQRLEESGTLQIVGVADPLRIGFDRLALVGLKCEMGKAGSSVRSSRNCPRRATLCSRPGRST